MRFASLLVPLTAFLGLVFFLYFAYVDHHTPVLCSQLLMFRVGVSGSRVHLCYKYFYMFGPEKHVLKFYLESIHLFHKIKPLHIFRKNIFMKDGFLNHSV